MCKKRGLQTTVRTTDETKAARAATPRRGKTNTESLPCGDRQKSASTGQGTGEKFDSLLPEERPPFQQPAFTPTEKDIAFTVTVK